MIRRTMTLGITVVALILATGSATAADADTASASNTTKASKSKKASTPTFTNADIDALPASGNSVLPSLEDEANAPGSANRFVIIGAPATEGEATAPQAEIDPEAAARSMQWVEQLLQERQDAARIGAAQRRVSLAEARIEEVERTYRPKGSAFSAGNRNTDQLFMRGVASKTSKYDDAVREAYIELAAARAELETLLSQSAARRAESSSGSS